MKKRVIIYSFIVLFLFVFTNNVNAAPVNKDFKDDVFYSVIIENLNARNIFGKSDRTIEHNVTDEELNMITYLSIDGREYKIKNFKGLNKLKELKTLILEYHMSISELDISENKELSYLRVVNFSSLHDIDFSNNTKLTTIDLTYTHLNSLDLKNCTNLRSLNIGAGLMSEKKLKYFDVSNCLNLNEISVSGHLLENVDLSNNINLNKVLMSSGNLKEITLPKDSKISTLNLNENNLKSLSDIINLENQNNLKTLRLNGNNITDVKLINKLPQNIEIYLDGNNQTIVLNKSKGTEKLPDIFIEAMKEDSIIYAKYGIGLTTNGSVKAYIKGNEIEYSNAQFGDKIIVKINGNPENNFIFNGIEVTYEFLPQNSYFEDANLFKIIIDDLNSRNVFGKNDRDINHKITEKELDTITRLSINGWPNDKNSIKINSMKGIENLKELETLEIKYQDIKELDISNNKKLKYVSIINADYLHDVDFLNNTELINLDLTYTHLKSLNLKNCKNLRKLKIGAGTMSLSKLEYFDVSECYNLNTIYICGHLLKEIDLRNNVNLKSVEITSGPLEKIVLPKTINKDILKIDSTNENLEMIYEKSNVPDIKPVEDPIIKNEKPILKYLLNIINF